MGIDVDREEFTEADAAAFGRRLEACLAVLRDVLARPGFGAGPPSLGAELELSLVGADGRPRAVNAAVLREARDPRLALETDRFNLECQTAPVALAGRPFAALGSQLDDVLAAARAHAARHGARLAMIGILPTLREADLQSSALTQSPRYRALSAGLRRLRREPFRMEIAGRDTLVADCDDVTFEGANTSWQVHLKVPPADFARTYNAAQIAVAPVLAVAGNSPTFLGRRLWDETRIALYRQSTDDRRGPQADDWRPARVSFGHGWVREGAWELFAESVALHRPLLPIASPEDPVAAARDGTPTLGELRLHQGIELRPFPAGPTVVDMLANAAFAVGLTLALAPGIADVLPRLTFGHARQNFYEAARHGIDAELLWPGEGAPSPQPVAVRALVPRLVALARDALVRAGVEPADADPLFEVIRARTASGQTGARWQRRALDAFEADGDGAFVRMLERYLACSQDGAPVHTWMIPPSSR
jgi:hypothetical protein